MTSEFVLQYIYIYILYTACICINIIYTHTYVCVYNINHLTYEQYQYRLQIILQQIAMQYIMLKEIKIHCLIPYNIPRYNILKCPSTQNIKINQLTRNSTFCAICHWTCPNIHISAVIKIMSV